MKAFTPLALPSIALAFGTSLLSAQNVESVALTDTIKKGDGVIDIMLDVSSGDLAKYFNQTGGLMLLGADVNEDNSGNESRDSLGVAIKQAQLSLTTTAGDFTFKDFFTSTSAMLRENGSSTYNEYQTLFGQAGSSNITGTGTLDISKFDDVMWLENIKFDGEITSAKLSISFVPTPTRNPSVAESFFDFSGGFEDFALLSAADAILLEEANIGVANAPKGLEFTSNDSVVSAIAKASSPAQAPTVVAPPSSSAPIVAPPAAPAPPFVVAACMGLLLLWKKRNQPESSDA